MPINLPAGSVVGECTVTQWEVWQYENGTPLLRAAAIESNTYGYIDARGVEWSIEKVEGWRDGASPRTPQSSRPGADGDWPTTVYMASKIITLHGYWYSPDAATTVQSLTSARALLGARFRTGRLLADDADGSRTYLNVTRGGPPIFTPLSPNGGEFSMAFLASDLLYRTESVSSWTINANSRKDVGAVFPVFFPLVFGDAAVASKASLPNIGNIPGTWIAVINGPVNNPTITHIETGRVMTFNLSLVTGQQLVIDSGARTVLLQGQNRRGTMTGQWFSLAPGTNTVTFGGSDVVDGTTSLTITAPIGVFA